VALRRVAVAATALSFMALIAWAAGLGPAKVPEALGIRSMTVDAPFRAPEPTAEADGPAVPAVTEVSPATAPDGTVDARIALLALVAVVGFGAGLATLRGASIGSRRGILASFESPADHG
jgi:hypothetical protein